MKTFTCPARARHCGGCPLLEQPYPEQLLQKQERVNALLGAFCKPLPILGMEQPLHYRNKAIATFTLADGRLGCGLYEEGSHRVVPFQDCLLIDRRLAEILRAVVQAAGKCRYSAYDEDRRTGLLRHVVLRRGLKTGECSVTIVTPTSFLPGSREFVRLLREACPDVTTVVQNINPRQTSAVLGSQEKILFGKGFVSDFLCGKRFGIGSRAFYQINPVQTERLYQTAIGFAGLTGKERVIDAYCGIGTIGLIAAPHAREVLGVELNAEAVKNALRNARNNGVENARFLCADAGQLMDRMAQAGESADLVFLDPPREGASEQFLRALLRLSPARVVYISCNPETQQRDLALLTKEGYRVEKIQPVDLFPHTKHIEAVVLLSKLNTKQHIEVELNLDELDLTAAESKATYEEIKEYVLEHTGLKVSHLYIAQVKQKYGIIERENYNKPKSENSRQPKCPPEKEAAITEALKYFGMI